jgi:hypothetical protein
MGARPKPKVIRYKFPSFDPVTQAKLEIMGLSSVPELCSQSMLGGPTPPEMEEENERRAAEYTKRKLAIINKYEVAEAFLQPLLAREAQLQTELTEIQSSIADLRALQGK